MRWMNLEPIIQSEVSQKEKDIVCNAYIRNLLEKWYQRIYLQGTNGETDIEDRVTDMGRRSNMETYITMCKIDRQREFAVWLRKLKQGLV